ncbi:MAG: hypothetical protein JNL70_11000 [Saprospiraceae bacterium]|nr:hypothetical protein [Saprospiraceae bacterium]
MKHCFTTVKGLFTVVKNQFTVVESLFTVVKNQFTVVESLFTIEKENVHGTVSKVKKYEKIAIKNV